MSILQQIKCPRIIGIAAWIMLLITLPFSAYANTASLYNILAPSQMHSAADGVRLCEEAIAIAERKMGIPRKLLHAIALGESGRGLPDNIEQSEQSLDGITLWPWTVMAEGKGRYFNSKFDAIKEIAKLRNRDIKNIDVGCMQVNLHYHGKAFRNINEAFNPIHNVAYAASFLKKLRARHKSWTKAVKFYHSATPSKHNKYAKKILSLWRKLQIETRNKKVSRNKTQQNTPTQQAFVKN